MKGLNNLPDCFFSPHVEELDKLYNKFVNNKKVKKEITDPDEAFAGLIESEFKMPAELFFMKPDVGKGEMKGLSDRLNNVADAAANGTLGGRFASMFYNPSVFAKKDPALNALLDNYIHVSHSFKANDAANKMKLSEVENFLSKEMSVRGLVSNGLVEFGKKFTRQTAQAEYDNIEMEIARLIPAYKEGNADAIARYDILQDKLLKLVTDSELQVKTEFIGYIENAIPDLIEKKMKDTGKKYEIKSTTKPEKPFLDKDDLNVIRDADGKLISSDMRNALYSYMELTDNLYFRLGKGVEAYVDTILIGKQGKSADQLKELKKNLLDKLLPNKEKGFYPHYSTDLSVDFLDGLMPRLEDLVLSSNDYFNSKVTYEDAIDNMNGYISKHTKSRDPNREMDNYSLNFSNVLNDYTRNVERFNYINYINKSTKQVLNKVEGMYQRGEYSSGYGDSVVEFVQDLHKAATGYNEVKNPQLNSMMRTLLGMEFISKIGFNPRSAVRNSSQALLNVVEFGPIAINNSRKFWKAHALDENKIMKESGLLFDVEAGGAELQEALGMHSPGAHTSIKFNETTGKLEHVPITRLEKAARVTSTIAGKAGWMMAKVENWNRKTTFKIGYSQMYNSLDNPNFDAYVKNKYKNTWGKEGPKAGWKKIIEKAKHGHSRDYAINMTIALHFDYNAFSKAKALRGPAGKVLGQFQHYGFKFFEYNMDTMRGAKNDILNMELNGNQAWKAYRLAAAYFLAPVIASTVTGIDFGNLIQHDTSDRIEKLWAGLTGDEEDRKKAFYGAGPVIGTIGAPIFSDLLNLGMMYEVINMDEESLLALLSGYEDMSAMTDDQRLYQTMRLLHPAVTRISTRTLPQLKRGNIGWAAQSELGLYPGKEAKERQEFIEETLHDLSPEMMDALSKLEEFGR